MTKIEIVRTAATRTRSRENPRSPTWKAVSACRSASPTAMPPKAVRVPVATTTARPEPWWTTVPMNAHDGRSTGESAPPGATVFTAATDSPVRTASSHSSWLASSSRTSAGTTSPTRSSTTSPGTSSRTSTFCWTPSRHATASWRMLACSAATACSDRYSLTKPSPTLRATIAVITVPSVTSPVAADTAAAASKRISSGLRS